MQGNVFKRCERENLFQVACADVVERFQMSLYLGLVAVQFLFVQKVEATAAEWLVRGWSGGQVVRWSDGQMVRWPDGQMVRWSDGPTARWSDGN